MYPQRKMLMKTFGNWKRKRIHHIKKPSVPDIFKTYLNELAYFKTQMSYSLAGVIFFRNDDEKFWDSKIATFQSLQGFRIFHRFWLKIDPQRKLLIKTFGNLKKFPPGRSNRPTILFIFKACSNDSQSFTVGAHTVRRLLFFETNVSSCFWGRKIAWNCLGNNLRIFCSYFRLQWTHKEKCWRKRLAT